MLTTGLIASGVGILTNLIGATSRFSPSNLGGDIANQIDYVVAGTVFLTVESAFFVYTLRALRRQQAVTKSWFWAMLGLTVMFVVSLFITDYPVYSLSNGIGRLLLLVALVSGLASMASRPATLSGSTGVPSDRHQPTVSKMPTRQRADAPTSPGVRGLGAILGLGGAAAVFAICSIVQSVGESSMFSTSFAAPDNPALEVLMQVTFWPGWLLTGVLAIGGVMALFGDN